MPSPCIDEFKMFDAKAVARRSVLSRRTAEVGTQTDQNLEYASKMKKAEEIWEQCLDVTTRLKFEEIRTNHYI